MKHFATRGVQRLLQLYQITVSPLLGPACRFEPNCSRYAVEALEVFGLARGSWLAARRVSRCHPLGASGYDPVPGRTADGS